MCLNIFIGSEKKLPIIPWNEENPGFCLDELFNEKVMKMIVPVLNSNFYYDVGSFMGCACGFSFGKWSKETNDNHEQRIANVQEFKEYLSKHLTDNKIKLFCTNWESFPETYRLETFVTSAPISDEFDFEEDIILLVE